MAGAFGLAFLVGIGVVVFTPAEYVCVATLRLAGAPDADAAAALHKDIFYFASQRLSSDDGVTVLPTCPDVPASADVLRLCATTTRRRGGVDAVRAAVEGYVADQKERVERTRVTPSESERLLSSYTGNLRARLETVQDEVDAAIANVPDDNPGIQRDALLARWRTMRHEFTEVRAALKQATQELADLDARAVPTHGIVPTAERREALEADLALQQDLAELAVNLAELKLQLLNVWRDSAQPLDAMSSAATELMDAATKDGSQKRGFKKLEQLQFDKLTEDARHLHGEISAFESTWTDEFASIKRTEPDAQTGGLIDAHQRIRSLLRDFLLQSDSRLRSMNQYLRALREGLTHDARYHVFHSALLRHHATLRAAFGRFEFAAGQVEPTDSFRLDVALRSARGLRRRTQRAIRHIDDQLEAIALRRARQRRIEQTAAAKQHVAELRIDAGDAIDRIVTIQDDLNLATGLTEGFLEAVVRAEMSALRTDDLTKYLAATERELGRLGIARVSAADAMNMELVTCELVGPSLNQGRRWGLGGVCALATLVLAVTGQWWINRAPTR